jgi:hypothetical protein
VDEPIKAAPAGKTAYGRVVRERGTLRVVLGVLALAAIWYAYDSFQTARLIAQKWPPLSVDKAGLTILGLRDKDRPGWRHKYEAREANHSWQIRRPDEAEGDDAENPEPEVGAPASGGSRKRGKIPGVSDPKAPEASDRETPSAIARRAASGAVVPIEEVLQNCPVVMLGKHFTDASVEKQFEPFLGTDYYIVHIGLTPEGRSRYWQFSRDHDKERLAFVLQGELFTCAEMNHMDVSSISISPIWVKADAERLAKFINEQKR